MRTRGVDDALGHVVIIRCLSGTIRREGQKVESPTLTAKTRFEWGTLTLS